MTLWIGRRQGIGIGVEATRGVGVSPAYWLNALSFSFADKPERALSEAGFGGIWGGDQAPVTLKMAEGDFEVELGDQSFGAILYALLGTLSSGTIVDESYTHTYTLDNTNQHKSLSLSTKDPIGNLIFERAMINSFTLTVEPNAIVKYTVNFISNSSGDTGALVDTYGAEKKFVGRNLSFKVASDTSGLGAATKINLKALTLNIEKNAEAQATLATIQPEDIVNKRFNVTGNITLNYEDRTWLNFVGDGDYKALRLALIHDDKIGAGGTPYSFTLDLSKVEFENWSPDFSLDEIVTQSLDFTSLYDAGGNDNVINSCTLVNAVENY